MPVSVAVPREASLTDADLQELPEDGNRDEPLDELLLVMPPPPVLA